MSEGLPLGAAVVGTGFGVLTHLRALRAAGFDSSKILFRPEAVVRVRKEEQVGVVLELAYELRVPVTTRGRGTTLTGAAAPRRGGWVVDLRALNRIEIDGEAFLIQGEPVRDRERLVWTVNLRPA